MKFFKIVIPLLSIFLLFITIMSISQQIEKTPTPHQQQVKFQTIVEYGQQCADLIGEIPVFSCNDGVDVPITVNGKIPEKYAKRMTCDRPAMLPYDMDNKEDTFGQCTPYSKILNLSKGDIQISAFCRREYLRDPKSEYYDEVDIILHSVKTGDTCWFHAAYEDTSEEKSANKISKAKGFNASRVPPPNEVTPPPGHVSAMDFWWTPANTAGFKCGDCHDADPFMYSPYIGQVWHMVPVDPFGWYNNHVGVAFQDWKIPKSISTKNNTCTGCHRIGNLNSCSDKLISIAAGRIPVKGGNKLANSYPLSHWMPANNFHSEVFWDEVYRQSVDDLLSCCDNPAQAMCELKPIMGKL